MYVAVHFVLFLYMVSCFESWQVTVPHVDADFFCFLEERGIGPEKEEKESERFKLYMFWQSSPFI